MTNKTGSTALSFTQQLLVGDPRRFVVGGRLYSYEAGTTTLVQPYKDSAATLPWPNPLTLGADGRIPLLTYIMAHDNAVPLTFVTVRSSVRLRLTDAGGVVQFDYDPVPLMTSDPGSGGGPAVDTTDPDALYRTGDMKVRYGIGTLPGYVRANGLTIGAPGSGATELQALDTVVLPLYSYLWGADLNLVVSGGRGLNAADDFINLKQLALPDFSGRALAFLDNMSGSPRGILTAATFGVLAPTVLGAQSGTEQHILTEAQLAAHFHDAVIIDPGHSHPSPDVGALFMTNNATLTTVAYQGGASSLKGVAAPSNPSGVKVRPTIGSPVGDNDKTSTKGSSAAHLNVQPTKLVTAYIKL